MIMGMIYNFVLSLLGGLFIGNGIYYKDQTVIVVGCCLIIMGFSVFTLFALVLS